MTIKEREKACSECGSMFSERKRDSNKQWAAKTLCSMKCNNSGKHRVTDIFIRLEAFQVKRDGCWLWSGSTDDFGYGKLSSRRGRSGSPERAHRVSFEKHYGEIPERAFVCHKCDNPECTNPDHLFLGTQKDNMMDCAKKGRISEKSKINLIAGCKGYLGAKVKGNEVKNYE